MGDDVDGNELDLDGPALRPVPNVGMQRKKSSHSEERRPDTIEITPDLKVIDLTETPTDTSPREEIQAAPAPLQTDLNKDDDLTRPKTNSTAFPVITDEQAAPTEPMTITQANRSIRFRSRVRITSGVHHHRHRTRIDSGSDSVFLNLSQPGESGTISSSPSSSISAPIRFREDEPTASSKWGPLGQRVRLFVSQQREKAKQIQADGFARGREARRRRELEHGSSDGDLAQERSHTEGPNRGGVHERSPLLSRRQQRQRQKLLSGQVDNNEEDGQERLGHEIDMVFGKWPGRLLNRHWWWWQIRYIACCNLADEWDAES
ncbi:hypothetical protein D9757_002158 [Collybiopsis confluens]|uniref:Uncharacterized protein n=1 Tax=Collybiopsis confluens TaxID=2823264 RepID=A0A8H5I042_9AGAR|nr:hypothetical protein D9757_002158 [Collybiopsis confluens]